MAHVITIDNLINAIDDKESSPSTYNLNIAKEITKATLRMLQLIPCDEKEKQQIIELFLTEFINTR
jgi:hypothetical protein